ncbi:MAG: hypothetical protein AAGI15_15050 [Pseudomonadota bacterium]
MAERSAPIPYWLISGFLFLWGLAYAALVIFTFGLATPEHWQGLVQEGRIRAEYAQYIAQIPTWAIIATLLAAITRLAGGCALLLRRRWAAPCYAVSLLLVATLMFRAFVFADVTEVIRPSQIALEAGFLALSVFAPWWARRQWQHGLLR